MTGIVHDPAPGMPSGQQRSSSPRSSVGSKRMHSNTQDNVGSCGDDYTEDVSRGIGHGSARTERTRGKNYLCKRKLNSCIISMMWLIVLTWQVLSTILLHAYHQALDRLLVSLMSMMTFGRMAMITWKVLHEELGVLLRKRIRSEVKFIKVHVN